MNRKLKKELVNIVNRYKNNLYNKLRLDCIIDMTNIFYNWYVFGKINFIYIKNKEENLLYKNINYYVRNLFSFISDLDQILLNLDIPIQKDI